MKLRLLDDSIRMRLSRSEVTAAAESGVIEGQTSFPDGSVFKFALEAAGSGGEAGAAYTGDRMVVKLPAAEITTWANDDEAVSLTGELALPSGGSLAILVEKDFQCLAPREGEDQSDLFRNPQG
jgi:hypothetical protein